MPVPVPGHRQQRCKRRGEGSRPNPAQRRALNKGRLAISPEKKKERRELFQKAYLRWLARVSPDEARRMLRDGNPMGASEEAKKSLFLEIYKHSWPEKIDSLTQCGLTVYWLQETVKKDPKFAADLLEIELNRVDKLKAFSYEQCFNPDNVAERTLWLKKIASEEFGDEPLVNLTNVIQNAPREEGFSKIAELLKRRKELEEMRQRLIPDGRTADSTGTPDSDSSRNRT